MIFREDNFIVSAGEDGFIRFWDFETLDNAESDDQFNFFLAPSRVEYLAHSESVANPFPFLPKLPHSRAAAGAHPLDLEIQEPRFLDRVRHEGQDLQIGV